MFNRTTAVLVAGLMVVSGCAGGQEGDVFELRTSSAGDEELDGLILSTRGDMAACLISAPETCLPLGDSAVDLPDETVAEFLDHAIHLMSDAGDRADAEATLSTAKWVAIGGGVLVAFAALRHRRARWLALDGLRRTARSMSGVVKADANEIAQAGRTLIDDNYPVRNGVVVALTSGGRVPAAHAQLILDGAWKQVRGLADATRGSHGGVREALERGGPPGAPALVTEGSIRVQVQVEGLLYEVRVPLQALERAELSVRLRNLGFALEHTANAATTTADDLRVLLAELEAIVSPRIREFIATAKFFGSRFE